MQPSFGLVRNEALIDPAGRETLEAELEPERFLKLCLRKVRFCLDFLEKNRISLKRTSVNSSVQLCRPVQQQEKCEPARSVKIKILIAPESTRGFLQETLTCS
ncbi:hypothetical protein CRENBAI_017904 [Crenichthys baileyi]|uniref:Uncharacterized protein n=1 Tax=Crenichthys baileyi TaxID=28760 RepID=A0AAV9RD34_9TELE